MPQTAGADRTRMLQCPYDDVSVVKKCQVRAGETSSPSISRKSDLQKLQRAVWGFENHDRGSIDALTLVSDRNLPRVHRYWKWGLIELMHAGAVVLWKRPLQKRNPEEEFRRGISGR